MLFKDRQPFKNAKEGVSGTYHNLLVPVGERDTEIRYIGHRHTDVWVRTVPCVYDSE